MKKNYVVGFVFNKKMSEVVLIEKKRPDWQRGLLNGVGGSIELGEYADEAMVREFLEETGVQTKTDDWTLSIKLFFDYCTVVFLGCADDNIYDAAATITDEPIIKCKLSELPQMKLVHNLFFTIPLTIQRLLDKKNENPKAVDLTLEG